MTVTRDRSPNVVKAPPWHGWVTADLSLNSLSTGIFAVAATCDLIAGAAFRPVVRAGYLAAFPLVLGDLICLIVDLGDPARFLHMLRVFKPSSPMSPGAWSTNAFAFFAFVMWTHEFSNVESLGAARSAVAAFGLVAALVTASYKGVLLSVTAQPGWKDARWLGAHLSISSGALGTAFALAIAASSSAAIALHGLRAALIAALALDTVAAVAVNYEMRDAVAARFIRIEVVRWDVLLIGGGLLAPLILLLTVRGSTAAVAAAMLTILAAPLSRHHLVTIAQRGPRSI
jgi:hypothetical protein